MKQSSLLMALVDYIPVLLFFLAAKLIYNNLKNKVNKTFLYVFVLGALMVNTAGFLKASYKLLYSLNIGDFIWMSKQMFPNHSIGFLLAGLGLILAVLKPTNNKVYAIPIVAFVSMMIIGLGAMDAGLCYIASKQKNRKALVMFIVSFFLSMMMGYLSSRDFTQASMNWVAEIVNICGQVLLYLGCKSLGNFEM